LVVGSLFVYLGVTFLLLVFPVIVNPDSYVGNWTRENRRGRLPALRLLSPLIPLPTVTLMDSWLKKMCG